MGSPRVISTKIATRITPRIFTGRPPEISLVIYPKICFGPQKNPPWILPIISSEIPPGIFRIPKLP